MAEIGQVDFADCVDRQAPRSHDAMSETDCNNTAKEGVIHEKNDDAAQSAIGEGMDQNSGSGKELANVTCAVLEASPGDIAPSTVEKTSEVLTRETCLSAPADTEASITDVAVSSREAAGPESWKNIQEESIQSSREEVPKGCVETDADSCAEQKPLLSADQGSDGVPSKHITKSLEMQDLILSTPNNTEHPEETSTELSKESNPDVEHATDPTKKEAIHTQVPVTDSAISGDASSKDTSESSFAPVAHVEETILTVNQGGEGASTEVAKLSDDEQLKDVPVSWSSPAVPPNSSSKEVASSQPSVSTSCPVVASLKQDQVLDSTVGSKSLSEEVENNDCGHNSEDGACVDDGEVSSAVSTAGEAAASTDLEGGQEATADSLDSPGRKENNSEDDFNEEFEIYPRLDRDDLDNDSGINEGLRGLEDELEDGLDEEEEDEDSLKGERQQGDGQESVDPSDAQDKVLDFDEDKRNPQYIPKKGAFYQHDDRMVGDEDASEVPEEKNEDDKGSRRQKKLWHDEGVWGHDMYREEEQGPKTSDELVSIYGYDIRTETMPPRARRRRRYGRGPNKYQRNWEDEEAYTPRSGSGRGGGLRGGRRTRGGGHIGNPPFRDEDFPDLNSKPSNSENSAAVQLDRTEVKPPARPTGFRTPSSPGSSCSQQEEWDHSVKGSPGSAHRGWGKRPSLPSRRVPDALPRQQDSEVKENASSGHRTNRPAPRSPVKSNEVPCISPSAGKSRAIRHQLTEHERSKKDFETQEKFAAKVELQDGDAADLKRSTAATVAPRGGPVGSTESAAKPRRYSSLRQRPLVEAAPYAETAVVAPQLPNTQAPLPAPNQPQPTILTAAHFQGSYAPYPDGYMLPPGQAPAVMPTPSQPPPPPVMAPTAPLTSSFLPPPAGIVSFPPQYPPPYTFPTQYAAPAPAAAPPTQTQAQKPPYYHGDIIYYNTQSQQHKQRPTPLRRPKAAIPIVPPPDSQGTAQESAPEPDGLGSHQSKSDEDLDDNAIAGTEPALKEGPTAQQAVGGL